MNIFFIFKNYYQRTLIEKRRPHRKILWVMIKVILSVINLIIKLFDFFSGSD